MTVWYGSWSAIACFSVIPRCLRLRRDCLILWQPREMRPKGMMIGMMSHMRFVVGVVLRLELATFSSCSRCCVFYLARCTQPEPAAFLLKQLWCFCWFSCERQNPMP